MNARRLAWSLTIAASTVAAMASAHAEPRAVLELFTSQGCSSCPPADKLMGELARDPTLVVMSLAVNYWDYLGWKDTLALAGHARREYAYSHARGDREVYTPQVVVNGLIQVLGSDKAAIDRAILLSEKSAAPLALPVSLAVSDDKLTVTVPSGKDIRSEVWLCPLTGAVPIEIERGENRGNTISYHNVVRRWIKLGDWNGKAESWTMPLADLVSKDQPNKAWTLQDIDSVAVLVQSSGGAGPGLMLGAAQASLH